MPASAWRLLRHAPGEGAWNMAVDEAVAAAVGAGQSRPTLRLYGWRRPTLSLGYLQAAGPGLDLNACHALGIPLVRRPTGGRAVLHHRELTYSLAVPLEAWGGQAVPARFRTVASALTAGLRRLGVDAVVAEDRASAGGAPRGACFRLRGMPAILCGGRKLVGSAERRWEAVVLQHGSLLLAFDADLHRAVFPEWERPESQVACLEAVLGRVPPPAELSAALTRGFADVFEVRWECGDLSPEEERAASGLVGARYADPAWTFRR